MRRAGRGMNSLLAAVEVASNHSPNHSDRNTTRMSNATPDEPRKGARVFTADERAILEKEYKLNKFPTRAMMETFAARLGKPTEKVRTWFNNRRALDRKMGVDVVRLPMNRSNARTSASNLVSAPVTSAGVASVSTTTQTPAIPAQQRNNVQREQTKMMLPPQPPALPAPPTPPNIPPIVNSNTAPTVPTSASLETAATAAAASASAAAALNVSLGSVVLTPNRNAMEQDAKRNFTTMKPIPPITLTPETPRRSPPPSRTATPSSAVRRISNVTPAHSTGTPGRATPVRSSGGRPRLTPVRLRSARLRLGRSELKGEGHKDDVGLEVKFLFGKKRLVYEWYCGADYADAKVTGGPYAKMETNFDSLYSMKFVRTRDGSIIEMTLSDTPSLYRQSEDNMLKFKVRSQQRQYQRASTDAFTVDVSAKDHCIHLRSDEAARVRKTIMESVPELALLVQESTPLPGGQQHAVFDTPATYHNERLTDTESISAAAGRNELGAIPKHHDGGNSMEGSAQMLVTPRPAKPPSEPSSFKSDVRPGGPQVSNSETGKESKDAARTETRTPIASAAHVWETPTRSNLRISRKRTADQALGPGASNAASTAGPSNAAFLIPTPATPAPWHSPATPFNSEIRTASNAHLWLATGGITPMSEQQPVGSPLSAPVRRALDFTPGKGTKRSLEVSDENDSASGNKPVKKVRGPPPPPVPPALPPPVPPLLPGQGGSAEEASKTTLDEQGA